MATFREAVASGSRLTALTALRDVLAARITDDETRSGEVAQLSKQLADVLIQIERLDPPKEAGNPLDELAERRAGRGASAPRAERTGR